MKTFRSIREIKEFYFPINTAKDREEEFMKTATPAEIGEYLAEQTMKKVRRIFRRMFRGEKKKLKGNDVI